MADRLTAEQVAEWRADAERYHRRATELYPHDTHSTYTRTVALCDEVTALTQELAEARATLGVVRSAVDDHGTYYDGAFHYSANVSFTREQYELVMGGEAVTVQRGATQ